MKKIKVLQLNKLYYPYIGGIECVVQQIAEGLNDITDMRVLVCDTGRKNRKELVHGVKVIRTGSQMMIGNLPLSLGYLREFCKQAKRSDILLFHAPFPIGDLVYLLSGIRNKRVILWWHSDIVRQKKMLILYKPLMYWFLKKVNAIIVATEGNIKGSAFLKQFQDKCIIIPFGIRQELEQDSKKYLLEKPAAESTERPVEFLFVGRLVYYKGCDILVRAFRRVEGAHLTIVGSGPLEQEMKDYVQKYHMEEKVTFREAVQDEQLMAEYRNCDVFVLPSVARSEAFGLVQIEAMAYGKPVINTKLPSGVPHVSLNHITGLTVKPGDEAALSKAMNWMAEHPEERISMGKRARERVEQEYLENTMLKRLYKVIEKEYSYKESL